jgi:hypothetical protein
MATTAITVLQDVWSCRWSRPGFRLTSLPEARQPESAWVCVRDGHERDIGEAECRTCAQWAPAPGLAAGMSVARHAVAAGGLSVQTLLAWSTQGILALTALLFVALGVVTLTGPLAVPFTVALWLCAAAFAGLVAFWRPAGY